MQHLRWEKSGRTLKGDKPNEFVYKSQVGQVNLPVGDGFAPYIYDPAKKLVKFAGGKISLTAQGIDFFQNDKKVFTGRFELETDKTRKTASISGFKVVEIDELDCKALCQVSYNIETEDARAAITLEAGGDPNVSLSFSIEAKKSGQHRLVLKTGLSGKPIASSDEEKPVEIIGVDFGTHSWRWDYREAKLHEQLDGGSVGIGEKFYRESETLRIKPDTWGPTQIAGDDDDGAEVSNTWYTHGYWGGDWVGMYNSYSFQYGGRWDNIPVANGVTISDGTKITYYMAAREGSTVPTRVRFADEDDAAAWSTDTRPTQRTVTDTYADFNAPDTASTWYDTPELKTLIQEVVDRAGWASGNAMAGMLFDNGADFGTNAFRVGDYGVDTGYAAKLTIVYGGVLSISAPALAMSQTTVAPTLSGSGVATISAPVSAQSFSGVAPTLAGSGVATIQAPTTSQGFSTLLASLLGSGIVSISAPAVAQSFTRPAGSLIGSGVATIQAPVTSQSFSAVLAGLSGSGVAEISAPAIAQAFIVVAGNVGILLEINAPVLSQGMTVVQPYLSRQLTSILDRIADLEAQVEKKGFTL